MGISAKLADEPTCEDELQVRCFGQVLKLAAFYPALKWMHHSPNGGKRPVGAAGKLKAAGTRKGFPDLVCVCRVGHWAGFAVEAKWGRNCTTAEQDAWLTHFNLEGYLTGVFRSEAEFMALMAAYLTVPVDVLLGQLQ